MTIAISTPVTPARKVRFVRQVRDTREVLFAKILEVVKGLSKEADRLSFTKAGQSIIDLQSGDTQPNRRAMVDVLREARELLTKENTQAEAKAKALAEYEDFVAPVREGWLEANDAWTKYVLGENALGHNGQKAIAEAFYLRFVRMEAKVAQPRGVQEVVDELVAELNSLTADVAAFRHDNWCTTCGAPVYEIRPRNKPAFTPKLCGTCYHAPVEKTKGKKGKTTVFQPEPLSPEEIEARRTAARELNKTNLLAKKARRRARAEESAGKSQKHEDGSLKSMRKHEKEVREQGGHPEGKKGKKGGKKK